MLLFQFSLIPSSGRNVSEAGTWKPHSTLTTEYRLYSVSARLEGKACILGGWSSAKNTIECLGDDDKWVNKRPYIKETKK